MIIGLTGGIGSGKSQAAELLEKEFSFSVIQTDRVASEMMNGNEAMKHRLKEAFGEEIYLPDGTLDRKRYAEILYRDPENQKRSDRIVHPAVWEETERRIRTIRENSGNDRNIAVETALPGKQLKQICDRVWHIGTDRETRIGRLMKTRNYSREYAETVMAKQPREEDYLQIADKVIPNNGTVSDLREEIRALL